MNYGSWFEIWNKQHHTSFSPTWSDSWPYSSRAQWPLAPNLCSWATKTIYFFHTNHILGTLDFTASELWVSLNFHYGEKRNWRRGEEWCWRPKRVLTCMKWSDWDDHHLVVCVNLTWKEFTIYKPWGKGLLPLPGLGRKKYRKRPATKPSPTRTPTDMDMVDKYKAESGNENT